MNPNLVPVAKRKPKAPVGQQPDWLFPDSSSKSTTTKPQNSSSRIQIEKQESAKGPKAPASKPTGKPAPPPQLLTLIGAFLADYGFTTTQRTFATERQSRSKIEGWNDQHGEKTVATLKDIFERYQKDTETKKTSLSDTTKEDTKLSIKKDKLAKKENKIKKKPVPVQDSSSSSEDSDVEMNDAPATTKPASKKAASSSSSSSGSSSSESSDSDADDEKEVPVAVVKVASPKAKANTLKRKAASSSSSSSSSNSSSDSSSEDEAPKSKKVKTAPAAAKSSSSSSSSDSDSSSDSNNDAKKVAAKAAQSSSSDDSSSDSSTQSIAKKTPLPDSSDSSSSDSDSDSSSDDEKKADTTAKSESTATLASSESDSSSSDSEAETKATNAKKQERKLSPPLPPTPVPRLPKRNNVPFSRIPKDIVVDDRLASNAFVPYDYAQRAHEDLIVTRGKGFTKEKNKKKRGSYRGGYIDVDGKKGIKFED